MKKILAIMVIAVFGLVLFGSALAGLALRRRVPRLEQNGEISD